MRVFGMIGSYRVVWSTTHLSGTLKQSATSSSVNRDSDGSVALQIRSAIMIGQDVGLHRLQAHILRYGEDAESVGARSNVGLTEEQRKSSVNAAEVVE